jgi:hypothetical protein
MSYSASQTGTNGVLLVSVMDRLQKGQQSCGRVCHGRSCQFWGGNRRFPPCCHCLGSRVLGLGLEMAHAAILQGPFPKTGMLGSEGRPSFELLVVVPIAGASRVFGHLEVCGPFVWICWTHFLHLVHWATSSFFSFTAPGGLLMFLFWCTVPSPTFFPDGADGECSAALRSNVASPLLGHSEDRSETESLGHN